MGQTLLSLGSTISVEMSELGPLSDQLNGVAQRYEGVGATLLLLTQQVALLAPLDVSGNGAQALASLGVSSVGVNALVTGTRHLAQAVSRSSQAYNEAEAFALTLMSGFTAATEKGKSVALSYGSAFGYRLDSLKIRVVEEGKGAVLSVVKYSLPTVRRTPAGYVALGEAAVILNDAVHTLGMTGRLRATRDMTGDLFASGADAADFMGAPPIIPQGVTDRCEKVHEIEERGDAYMSQQGHTVEWDHTVVETMKNPTTGETMYLVTIPGTDGNFMETLFGSPRGGVNSWTSTVGMVEASMDPHLAPEDYTALMSLVEQAMKAAGVPEGANVSFMGFSQGAIAAAAVANNDTFNSRYRVKGLVTQAGPVDHIKVRDEVTHVDLRHEEDIVPMLSGDRPDYEPDESYTYTTMPASGSTHGAKEYQEMARLDPQAQQPLDGLEEIFGGYVSVDAGIYSGTTQKPDMTQEEQAKVGALGIVNLGVQKETGISVDINPADLYQDAEDLVQSVERGLGDMGIGGVEIFDSVFEGSHPGEGTTKPSVPVPDHKIKVYEATPQDHLENLGNLLGVPDIPDSVLGNNSIQMFEPELVAG